MISTVDDKQTLGPVLDALGDATRRRIVVLLSEGPRAATDIYDRFPIADPAVSRHLRVLREAGLVSERRSPDDGRVRIYSLSPTGLDELSGWLAQLRGAWQRRLEDFQEYVAVRKGGPT